MTIAKVFLVVMCCLVSTMAAAASNTLSWTVKDEKEVFGYIVYRADRREGPYLRASEKIIRNPKVRMSPPSTSPATYLFEDKAVQDGRTYYYFIDVISTGGKKQRLSGVVARTVASGTVAN